MKTVLEYKGKLELEKIDPIPICDAERCPREKQLVGLIRWKDGAANIATIEGTLWLLNGRNVRVIIEMEGEKK